MPHVLLVDDEEPLRESLSYSLRKEGYTVETAADGHNAIKQFHKQVPDVILLDSKGRLLASSSHTGGLGASVASFSEYFG